MRTGTAHQKANATSIADNHCANVQQSQTDALELALRRVSRQDFGNRFGQPYSLINSAAERRHD